MLAGPLGGPVALVGGEGMLAGPLGGASGASGRRGYAGWAPGREIGRAHV